MNNKYSVGLFISFFIIVSLLSFNTYNKYPEKEDIEKNVKSVTTDGHALSSDCYYLYEVNGYVVVFLADKKTPYEFTNILYEELPALIRQEIKNGKYIENTEALYGFLENYSS